MNIFMSIISCTCVSTARLSMIGIRGGGVYLIIQTAALFHRHWSLMSRVFDQMRASLPGSTSSSLPLDETCSRQWCRNKVGTMTIYILNTTSRPGAAPSLLICITGERRSWHKSCGVWCIWCNAYFFEAHAMYVTSGLYHYISLITSRIFNFDLNHFASKCFPDCRKVYLTNTLHSAIPIPFNRTKILKVSYITVLICTLFSRLNFRVKGCDI